MACLVFVLLLLAMAGHSSTTTATWCTCKGDMDNATLQKTLDYACGAGADCRPTQQNGPCSNPNTVMSHCSYAVNSYFQIQHQVATACVFTGSASIVATDPSYGGCTYPTTASPTTTTTTTPMTPPTTGTGIGTPFMPNSLPLVTTPSTGTGVLGGTNPGTPSTGVGVLGGISPGTLGPSGFTTDFSEGGVRLPTSILLCSSIIITFSTLVFW